MSSQNAEVRVVRLCDVKFEEVGRGQALLADAASVSVDSVVMGLAVDQLRKCRLEIKFKNSIAKQKSCIVIELERAPKFQASSFIG